MQIRSRLTLAFTLLIAANLFAQECYFKDKAPQGSRQTNIILLMADDLGYGDVGFNGNRKIITPHLDRMAQEGIRLDHFYAAAPLCSPTRASCLTGRSPFQAGTVDYLPTILDLLGFPVPKKRPLDGISLVPALKCELAERPIPLAFGYQRLYKDTELYALIKGKYKMCIPELDKNMMLFDLDTDQMESKDLSTPKPKLLTEMKAELAKIKDAWRASREGKDYAW